MHLSVKNDVDHGDALGREGRSRVEPTKLFDETLGERRVLLELLKLIRVLQKRDDSLDTAGGRQRKTWSAAKGLHVKRGRKFGTHESDHRDHGGISGDQHQERNLDHIFAGEVARAKLFSRRSVSAENNREQNADHSLAQRRVC